jgi:hypothetical protein
MELYPSIPATITNTPIYAFDKLDGSNIRAEWSRKNGFTKFGTRKRLLDAHEKPLGEAVELFMNKYSEDLGNIFRKARYERATAFVEFTGENSFAGYHEDEKHTVTLFDIHVYKRGLLSAPDFLSLVEGKVDTAAVLYHGNPTQDFIDSVRNSELPGMTFEGVVCKGGLDNRRRPINFKVKSLAWKNKLKDRFGYDEKLLQKLM